MIKPGFGALEKFTVAQGGWAAIAGAIVFYLPQVTAGHDWGQYNTLVFAITAATVGFLKTYFQDTTKVAEKAVEENEEEKNK